MAAELPEDPIADATLEYLDAFEDYPPWWTYHSDNPAKRMRDAIKKGEKLPEEQGDDTSETAVMQVQ